MSLVSYLITMFAGLFWIFRVVIAVTMSLNIDLGFNVPDLTTEIVILFITLICLVLVVRRNIAGAIMYAMTYGWYFGKDIVNAVAQIQGGTQLSQSDGLNVFMAFVAVILAVATIVDIALNKNRKGSTKDKKTDWFYKNGDFDREFDERSDRNNYKF